MKARVNGVERDIAAGSTVADLLAVLGAPSSGVAVALDAQVVPRTAYQQTVITDGAVIEVLTAVQGG
jgi:sulfur carrier protein